MRFALFILFSLFLGGCLSALTKSPKYRQPQEERYRHEHEDQWSSEFPQLNQPRYGDVSSFEDGKQFKYLYEGQILTGMPDVHKQFSGLRLRAIVNIQLGAPNGKDLMQIEKVFVGSIHERFVSEPMSLIPTAFVEQIPETNAVFEEVLKKPIRFNYENGKVKEFETTEEDPSWSINMKRAILTTFHLSLNDKEESQYRQPYQTRYGQSGQSASFKKSQLGENEYPQFFTVMEDGAAGRCEASYTVLQTPDSDEFVYPQLETVNNGRPIPIPRPTNAQVLNVTKSYNFKNCEYRPFYVHGMHMSGLCSTCEEKPEEWSDVIEATAHTRYNISGSAQKFLIESAITEAIYKVTPKHQSAGSLVAFVNMTMTLISADAQSQPIRFPEQSSNIIDGLHMINPEFLEKRDEDSFLYETPEAKNPIVQKKQYWPFVDEKPRMVKQIFEKFVKGLENEAEDTAATTILIGDMIHYLKYASPRELREVHEQIKSINVAQVEKEEIEHLFIDILSSTGTNATFTYIVELAQQKKIEGSLLVDTLALLPARIKKVNPFVLDKLHELCLSFNNEAQQNQFVYRACWLAYGSMVHKACYHKTFTPEYWNYVKDSSSTSGDSTPRRPGQSSQFKKFSPMRLGSGKSQIGTEENPIDNPYCPEDYRRTLVERSNVFGQMKNDEEKIQWLKSIKNMGLPEFIPTVEEIIEDESLPVYIRTQAIYALVHMVHIAPQEVYQILLPIYHTTTLPYQLRIAAYAVVIYSQPPIDVLQSIAQKVNQEPVLEVASYVYSSLSTIGNLSDPCLVNFTQDVRTVLYTMAPVNTDSTHSKNIHYGLWSEYLKQGIFMELATVADLDSIVPRSAKLRVRTNIDERSAELLEFGYETEGFGQNIRNYIGNLTREALSAVTGGRRSGSHSRNTRQTPQSTQFNMDEINQKLRLKTIEPKELRGTAYLKVLGEETRFAVINPDTVGRFLVEIFGQSQQALSKLTGEGYKMEQRRVLYPQFELQMPTVFGVPVYLWNRLPLVASMKGRVKVQMQPKPQQIDFSLLQHVPETVKVDTDFITTLDGQHIYSFGVYAGFIKVATGITTKLSIEVPVKGSLLFRPAENLTKFTWDIPENPTELLKIQKYPTTVVRKYTNKPPSFKPQPERRGVPSKAMYKVPSQFSQFKDDQYFEQQYNYENQYQQYSTYRQSMNPQSPRMTASQQLLNMIRYVRPTPLITGTGRDIDTQFAGLPIPDVEVWEIPTNNFTKSAVYNFTAGHESLGVKVNIDAQSTYPVGTPFKAIHPIGHKGYLRILTKPTGQAKALTVSMYEKREIVKASEKELINKLKDKMPNLEIKDIVQGRLTPPTNYETAKKYGYSLQFFVQPSSTPSHQQQGREVQPGQVPTDYQMRLFLGIVYSWDVLYMKSFVMYDSKLPAGPKVACFTGEMRAPERTGLWYITPQTPLVKPIEGIAELSYGQQCGQENLVRVHLKAAHSGEQLNLNKQDLYDEFGTPLPYSVAHEAHEAEGLFQSLYKKCEEDRQIGAYFTEACVDFVKTYTDYLVYKINVEYTHISRPTLKLLQKAEQIIQHMFYWNTYVDEVDVYPQYPESRGQSPSMNQPKKFNATIAFSADRRYVNIYYNTTIKKVQMINLRLPFEVMPLNAVEILSPLSMIGIEAPGVCDLTGPIISTFDGLESEMPLSECYHLLAKDISRDELFAVLVANANPTASPQEIRRKLMVIIGEHQIEIVPPQGRPNAKVQEYTVLYNGQPVPQPPTENKFTFIPPTQSVSPMSSPDHQGVAYVTLSKPESTGDKEPILAIISPVTGIKVLFDGNYVEIKASVFYKNSLAGLCGNYNGLSIHDDVLPQSLSGEGQIERAEDEYEWSRAYVLPKDNCNAQIANDQKTNLRQSKSPKGSFSKKFGQRVGDYFKAEGRAL